MDAAERRAMAERHWHAKMTGGGQHPIPPHGDVPVRPDSVGRSPYRGGGRRGGGPFRGGGRGNFGHNPPRSDSRSPPFRGRGRMGRGRGGRRFPHPSSGAPSSNPEPAAVVSPPSAPPAARPRRAPKVAWCDLCRVDCNTQEILEIHKNGKRHKKLMQKMEELGMMPPAPVSDSQPIPVSEFQSKPVSESQPKLVEEPENIHGEGEKKETAAQENLPTSQEKVPTSQENLTAEAATEENKMETEQEIGAAEQSQVVADGKPTEATPYRKRRMDSFDGRRRGGKRNLRGRGGKRLRTSGMVSGSAQPLPKEQPKVCSLCNVTCDTQAVFECHLAGKKHLSRIKRYPDQEGTYSTAVPHPMYMPPSQPTVFDPQSGDGDPLVQQVMETKVQEVLSESRGQEAVMVESAGMTIVSESQRKEVSLVPENSAPSLMNNVKGDDNVIQTAENVPVPAYVEEAILPGLDIKVEGPSSNNELPTNQEMGSQ
eukprot:TRINITY_DN66_c0_g4_i1.p1 TRINITY_DN66_c0_g4~~TRINITY_DN66_c0_g4_i1.p1  ORF type:complete len:498 (+),score=84.72 TRINITY_DN66_c0_g4_i1:46-1494(+)